MPINPKSMTPPIRLICAALLSLSTITTQADTTTLGIGSDSSLGKYGQESPTRMQVHFLSLSYDSPDFTHKLVIPWLKLAGPASASGQGDLSLLPLEKEGHTQTSGLGDILLGSTWKAWESRQQAFDLSLKLKLPTGNREQGLSTGKPDLSALVSAYQQWGKTNLLGTIGYKQVGKPTTGDYRNTIIGSLGMAYRLNADQQWGFSYDWAQSALRSQGIRREFTIYGSQRLAAQWQLQAWLYTGFTPASPDLGGGLGLSYRF